MAFEYFFPFLLMIFGAFWQFLNYKNLNFLFGFIVVYMILLAGLRDRIGPDWPGYEVVFYTFKNTNQSIDFVQRAYGMEIGYVLMNKVIATLGFELWFFYLLFAGLSVYYKALTIKSYSKYTFLSLALYFVQYYFFEEFVHLRQGLALALIMYSFKHIVERNFSKFLLFTFIASSIHVSSLFFLIAYWLYTVKIPKNLMIVLLIISFGLSQVKFLAFLYPILKLTSGASYSLMKGLSYLSEAGGEGYEFSYADVTRTLFVVSLIVYKDYLTDKDKMFNGLINYVFLGSFFFFVFKTEPIYSSRLSANFTIFNVIVFPRLLYFIFTNKQYYIISSLSLFLFVFLMYFRIISMNQGALSKYENIIYNPSETHMNIGQ